MRLDELAHSSLVSSFRLGEKMNNTMGLFMENAVRRLGLSSVCIFHDRLRFSGKLLTHGFFNVFAACLHPYSLLRSL
jgi:hypothetical protein